MLENILCEMMLYSTLLKKCPYSDFILGRIFSHSDWIRRDNIMRENTDQNNSEYGHFFRSIAYVYRMNLAIWNSRKKRKKIRKQNKNPKKDIFFVKPQKIFKQNNIKLLDLHICVEEIFLLSRPYHFKFFKGCLPEILLGPLLNTSAHVFQRE